MGIQTGSILKIGVITCEITVLIHSQIVRTFGPESEVRLDQKFICEANSTHDTEFPQHTFPGRKSDLCVHGNMTM